MAAGVGHYPAILDAAELIFADKDAKTTRNADLWISRGLIHAVVNAYEATESKLGSVPGMLDDMSAVTKTAMNTLTDDVVLCFRM